MIRHLRASILVGALSAGLALLLFASGLLTTSDQTLYKIYSLKEKHLLSVPLASLLLSLFFAFAIAWTTLDITMHLPRGIVAIGALLVSLGASWVASLYNTFLSPSLPCITIFLSFSIGAIFSATKVGRRKRILEHLFGRRLAQSQLYQLVDSNQSIFFPGSAIEATVMVISIQNHAELMEMMPPEAYTAMTNFYLRGTSDFLVESGGYLEQCDGESIRVLFGAPLPDDKHAIKACRIALDLTKRLDTFNVECDFKWQQHIDFRIGIHSGTLIAAAFGGTRLGGFSVAGNTPDFARKLCTACSTYGCRILTANDTLEPEFDTFEVRPIELICLRADGKRMELYEVLALKHGLSEERKRSRDHFWKGVLYFREQKFDKANDEFSLARIKGIPDPVLDYYLERLERVRRHEKGEIGSPALVF